MPSIEYGTFTLTKAEHCHELVGRAAAVQALVGEPGITS
jgi:hypothetical protein